MNKLGEKKDSVARFSDCRTDALATELSYLLRYSDGLFTLLLALTERFPLLVPYSFCRLQCLSGWCVLCYLTVRSELRGRRFLLKYLPSVYAFFAM